MEQVRVSLAIVVLLAVCGAANARVYKKGAVYALAGFDGSYLKSVEILDVDSDTWTYSSDTTINVSDYGTTAVNINGTTHVVIVGGLSPPRKALSRVQSVVYNGGDQDESLANEWEMNTVIPALPEGRSFAPVVTIGHMTYVLGGFIGKLSSDVLAYDLRNSPNGSWMPVKSLPAPARDSVGAAAAGGQVYVVGGNSRQGPLKSCLSYNPATDEWSSCPDLNVQRVYPAVIELQGKLYACAGEDNFKNAEGTYLKSVEVLDLTKPNPKWEFAADMNEKRWGPGIVNLNDEKILICGGFNNEKGKLTSCEKYDPDTNTWTETSPLLHPRFGYSMTAIPAAGITQA